ncbi:MAG: hypothetical protein A2546_07230 [Sphingobacteriia bacterium RIFOXYD2_FULL_35_12]|nr:MAG: hypothetical protein A2546_07230 [Sphingobacteriia bacterium RIFOXYD2_FULL_35_12]
MNEKEFLNKYWYKVELTKLCKKFCLQAHGTKSDLEKRILSFLKNGTRSREKNVKRNLNKNHQIGLQSKFFEDGLSFNNNLRSFISLYLGVKKNSFTKHMAHAVRVAKKEKTDITVAELIKILKTPKHFFHETDEDKTYQWNNFVKDFNKSKLTHNFKNKLNIAALLWQKIRNSSEDKIYSDSLLKKYSQLIKKCNNT